MMDHRYFEDAKVRYTCALCGEPIYVGDDYYEIADDPICEDCVKDAKKYAEDDEGDFY